MNVIIPIGGVGSRFQKHNYEEPKPLINALTKPMITWVIDSLVGYDYELYIAYNNVLEKYNFESIIKTLYPKHQIKMMKLTVQTKGAIDTINKLCDIINNENPVLCIDCDTFYTCDILKHTENIKNGVIAFEDSNIYENPPYSYITFDKENEISNIEEKKKISNYACSGAYKFQNKHIIKRYYQEYETQAEGELYTSKFIRYLIARGKKFNSVIINAQKVHNLGTPLNLQIFCNNYPINSLYDMPKIDAKRICFDLDNTLVTSPETNGDYTTVLPITININMCNYLKKLGHYIIIYTARKMKSYMGNEGKCIANVGKITLNTLDEFHIQYDEIYFGKPYADYYIDDKAINAAHNLEKALGCYTNVSPRFFNKVELNTYKTIIKKSRNELNGEIYYYKNIPYEIKDMFPVYFGSKNAYEYEIEYIEGISLSKQLMSSKQFVLDILPEVFESINRFHKLEYKDTKQIRIEGLYAEKIESRFIDNFETYGNIEDSNDIYEKLMNYFETSKISKICVMHGDPVFSNIIVNMFGKFKFIDMRGCVGDQLTIFGDMFYDYGKLYQSIIGYDYILNDQKIDYQFVNEAKKIFEKQINNEKYIQHIKMVTASLIFSMLPLHDDKLKITKYIQLIKQHCIL